MPKTPAQAVLDQVVSLELTPLLRAVGFKKAGRIYRRSCERCVQVVSLQASSSSSAEELRFTINLGVFFPEVHAIQTYLCWKPSAAGPTEYQCQFRSRIGTLMPAHRDTWWTLRANDGPEAIAAEVSVSVREFGLPWLESLATWEEARSAAKPIDVVAFDLASGDKDQAQRHLAAFLSQKPLASALRMWARDLGLEI